MRSRSGRIAGVDEAGRGPIAGPVVAAAVILPVNFFHPLIRDSKSLSPRQRIRAYEIIGANALAIGVGIVGPKVIDRINIRNASFQAMLRAIKKLRVVPDFILVDGFEIPGVDLPQSAIIGGDAKEISISAASIVAKVTRDRIMISHHHRYPQYGFDTNKGYPTRFHIRMLKRYGPSPVHRFSYRPVADVRKG
mgnify:CR=1 FL=1